MDIRVRHSNKSTILLNGAPRRLENEPKPKKTRRSRPKVKLLFTVFFDFCGVIHFKLLPSGQTVNKEYCLSIFKSLADTVRSKQLEL